MKSASETMDKIALDAWSGCPLPDNMRSDTRWFIPSNIESDFLTQEVDLRSVIVRIGSGE